MEVVQRLTSTKLARNEFSGEHRLPACSFRQPAEKLIERSLRVALVGCRESSARCQRQQDSSLRSPEPGD